MYSPASSQEQVAGSPLSALVDRLYAGQAGQAIVRLLDTDEDVSDEQLEQLERLILMRAKREDQGK